MFEIETEITILINHKSDLEKGQKRDYYINIAKGIDKNSGKKGFLLLNEFKTNKTNNQTDFFKNNLYSTPIEAFHFGLYKMKTSKSEP